MEPTDLTVKILQEIRQELRGQRSDSAELRGDFAGLRSDFAQMHADFSARFEIIEKTLKDLSEQMLLLARGIKTALEVRGRMDDLERRLSEVEKREPH